MEFKVLTEDQVRRLDRIEAGAALGDRLLAKLIDDALAVELGELPNLGISNITGLQAALDAKLTASQGASVALLSAAAAAGTDAALIDALNAKVDELIGALNAAGIIA